MNYALDTIPDGHSAIWMKLPVALLLRSYAQRKQEYVAELLNKIDGDTISRLSLLVG